MDDCDFGSQLYHKMEKMKPDWGYTFKTLNKYINLQFTRNHVVDLMQGPMEIVCT
jgi:hypothetical protein